MAALPAFSRPTGLWQGAETLCYPSRHIMAGAREKLGHPGLNTK